MMNTQEIRQWFENINPHNMESVFRSDWHIRMGHLLKENEELITELEKCKQQRSEVYWNNKLRAELAKVKRQWAEDDRDITALEDENNRLRAELEEERQHPNKKVLEAADRFEKAEANREDNAREYAEAKFFLNKVVRERIIR
jgi:hypothetical protein